MSFNTSNFVRLKLNNPLRISTVTTTCLLWVFSASINVANAISLHDIADQPGNWIDCETVPWEGRIACERVTAELDQVLSLGDGDIELSQNELTFNMTHDDYHPDIEFADGRVAGNCSSRIDAQGGFFEVKVKNELSIPITSDAISQPIIIVGQIPIAVKYHHDFVSRIGGANIGPGCWTVDSDSFDYIGEANADLAINGVISLEPSFLYHDVYDTSTGSFEETLTVTLSPIVSFKGSFLENIEFDFREEGRDNSWLQASWTAITGIINIPLGVVELAFNGFDLLGFVGDTYEGLFTFVVKVPRLDQEVLDFFTDIANGHFNGKAYGEKYFDDAEEALYNDLATALNLDANGNVSFDYRVADLERQATAEILPAIMSILN